MKFIYILILTVFSANLIAQVNLDSLEKSFGKLSHDSVRINLFLEWKSKLTPDQRETGLKIDKKVLSISDKNLQKKSLSVRERNYFKNKKGRSFTRIGMYYLSASDYSKAIANFQNALKIFNVLSDKVEIANCYSNIGVAHIYKGNYSDALQFSLKALKVREEIGDTLNMAASYNNIAYLYTVLEKYDLSMDYNMKALAIYENLKMEQDVGGVYINIGILYRNMNNLDKALEYYLKAIPIKEKGNNKMKLGDLYNNISAVYSSLGDYNESLKYAQLALDIHRENGNTIGKSGSLANVASACFELGQYSKAKACLEESLPLSKQINHKMTIAHVYLSLSMVDSAMRNYNDALQNYKMYIKYRDSLYNEENTRKSVEAEMNYKFGKEKAKDSVENAKQKQLDKAFIEKQNAEIRAKRNQQIYWFIGSGMILVFAGFMYNRFRITSRQKKIIEKQKAEVEVQKHLVDEKQKEILDSINYAKRLQHAILTPLDEIKKHFRESFLLYKPKDIVAGDFYFFEATDSHIFYAAADCTGHGVPGAMVSIVCSNALTRSVKEFELNDPAEILGKTREIILDTFRKSGEDVKDGMDISIISVNRKTNQIKWSGANNPLWYIQNGEMLELKPDKQPIGKVENPQPFTSHILPDSISSLYLFTDGYADQFGGSKGKKFKYSNLNKLLTEIHSLEPEIQNTQLETTFLKWKGDLEQVDDVCIIGIKIS